MGRADPRAGGGGAEVKLDHVEKIVLSLLALVVIALAGMIPVSCVCMGKQDAQAYAAWCKLYNRTDITFDEWQAMKIRRCLPGQAYDWKGRAR